MESPIYLTAPWKLSLSEEELNKLNEFLDAVNISVKSSVAEKNASPDKYAYKQSSYESKSEDGTVIEYYPISVFKVADKSTKKNIFITEAVIPEEQPSNVINYYSDPELRRQYEYDTMDCFRRLYIDSLCEEETSSMMTSTVTYNMSDLTISKETDDIKEDGSNDDDDSKQESSLVMDEKSGLGLCEKEMTLSIVKVKQLGPVSQRLYLTCSRIEFASEEKCQLIGTYLRPDTMKDWVSGKVSSNLRMSHAHSSSLSSSSPLSSLTLSSDPLSPSSEIPCSSSGVSRGELLGLSKSDLTSIVLGKNLIVSFSVSRHPSRQGCCLVRYVLQVDFGGWIPQFATDLGIADQHLIKLFQRLCEWLLNGKKPLQSSMK